MKLKPSAFEIKSSCLWDVLVATGSRDASSSAIRNINVLGSKGIPKPYVYCSKPFFLILDLFLIKKCGIPSVCVSKVRNTPCLLMSIRQHPDPLIWKEIGRFIQMILTIIRWLLAAKLCRLLKDQWICCTSCLAGVELLYFLGECNSKEKKAYQSRTFH